MSQALAIFAYFVGGYVSAQGCDVAASPGIRVERLALAMGTTVRIEVVAHDRGAAVRASEAALQAIEADESRLSTWRDDSELSRFLEAPVGTTFVASEALCVELRRAMSWSGATSGAFDPVIGALIEAYDLRGAGRWPGADTLAAALACSGAARLDVGARRLERAVAARVDAGGFGKGAALDAAARALRAAGATSAVLDFGGQLRWIGPDQRRVVEIADPRDRSRAALRLSVDGGSVATTCNSERRRIVDGRPLGHLIDPRTGRPAADFGAVSVWTREAIDADCLSTACFVLGPDAALALAERLDGVEIVVLRCEEDSGALTARLSSGLKGRVTGLLSELEQLL